MKKWNLNVDLLRDIFDVCGKGMIATLEKAGIAVSTWRDWMEAESKGAGRKKSGGITVLSLVRLCNVLSVPVMRLFYEDGEGVPMPSRQELVEPSYRFVPARFDLKHFHESFGKRSEAGKTVVKMLEELGYSTIVHARWLREDSTLRVVQLLHVCNTYGYDLSSYFIGGNPSVGTGTGSRDGKSLSLEERLSRVLKEKDLLESELDAVHRENVLLRGELKKAKEDVSRLSVEKSELAYEVVRLKQYIKRIEGGFTGVAADNG